MKHRTPARACRHTRLATSSCCRIDRCDHGTFHVSLGDLTLRIREPELRELAETFGAAARSLGPPSEPVRSSQLLN